MKSLMKNTIRPIALALVFVGAGFLLRILLKMSLDIEISMLLASVVNFVLAAIGAFLLFPRLLKELFGEVVLPEYLRRLGFYFPRNAWRHILLGVVLAICTLGGMLVGSIMTGRYVLDWSTIDLSHVVFSTNPGVWEEFYFRGVIMVVLIVGGLSVRRAALFQVLLFGLAHIKGTGVWVWLDVFTVILLGAAFTYSAHNTRTLVAGIVFHFLHDALLFVVQVPGAELFGFSEGAMFYGSLWVMIGVVCLLIKVASEKLGVQAQEELYQVEPKLSGKST
jgi:membrane protease YdiL (CAAX protease family)